MNAVARLLKNPRATLRALDCLEARDDFLTFCGMVQIPTAPIEEDEDDDAIELKVRPYRPPKKPTALHHIKLAKVLQALDDGTVKRAMFFLPPGCAKSTYGSVLFPAWFMGRKPRRNVGVATYATDLARKMGRRVRSVVRQPVYREIFGKGLSGEVSAANEWQLEDGNEFMGNGIAAGWTGNRLDGLVVDDPIKGRQEASSDTVKKNVREAFEDDLRTRLKPGGWILLIQTRWAEDDLAGSLLPDDYDGETGWVLCKDGEWWYVVCIPAQAERVDDPLGRKIGQYIWPEWFGKKNPDGSYAEENPGESHWAPFKLIARTWASLCQQRPRPQEGTFFQEGWFRRFVPAQRPAALSIYFTSDHAPGGGEDNDFNIICVWGVDEDGDVWLLDVFREQCTMDVFADELIRLLKRYRPFCYFPEDDNSWKASAGFITKRLREAEIGARIEPIAPHGADKATRALGFQGLAAQRRVWLPIGPDGDAVLTEFLKFPLGKHDDVVDASAVIGKVLEEAHPAIVRPKARPEVRKRYGKRRKVSNWAQ
jgi:predicted phage terminase large subunit-like protein